MKNKIIEELEKEIERLKKLLSGEAFDHSERSVKLFIKLLENNHEDFGIKRAIERDDLRYNSGVYWKLNEWTFGVVECRGGSEGDGEEHFLILTLIGDGNKTFWKIPGYYSSYEGGELEWDSIHKVEPFERNITDYRQV
jgi:hypothetical protein